MMNTELFQNLSDWGCDVKDALRRLTGDEALYVLCLHTFAEDPLFEQLETQINTANLSAAFESAHTLKGVAGNLSLTPLYQAVCSLMELLRPQKPCDCLPSYHAVMDAYHTFVGILNG